MRDSAYIERWLRGEEYESDGSDHLDASEKLQFWHNTRMIDLETKKKQTICQRLRGLFRPPPVEQHFLRALATQYDRECLTLTAKNTPDPFIVRAHHQYYMVGRNKQYFESGIRGS